MRFTIFGSSGFIGGHLLARLRAAGHDCLAPERCEIPEAEPLGHVFYCIGLTSDFRTRLSETVQAHVCHLMKVLTHCNYDRLCYLSSTRVYKGLTCADESSCLLVQPSMVTDIYDLSKLMGEAACLHIGPGGVVVRLSNVIGRDDPSDNFLNSVLREVRETGRVVLRTALDSSKDYVLLEDVLDMLPRILVEGRENMYNLASGRAVTHAEIVGRLGCPVEVGEGSPTITFPQISIARLQHEFDYAPRNILSTIAPCSTELLSLIDECPKEP